ncbi:hypothetical protein LZ198_07310 [Myxococcus sp. K15C18031901]|uniref:hypothetical protein n=1 Tax=Myxococcus dinghuensis TaxID=2906761 RepID=UPI0020A7F17E|nr:hypothetical protein [Myxococcus dinghuensis]MCP3098683.1 hypothetical protein [Myxococcus dinghuensis]
MTTSRERLSRWLGALDAPGARVPGSGTATLLVLVLVPFLAPMLSGAVRAALRVDITWALALSVALVAGGVALAWWQGALRAGTWTRVLPAVVVLGAVMAATFHGLYTPAFGGLVSVGGGDAGNHVSLRHAFVETTPLIYEQFVAFHAFTHWLEVFFGLDAFGSFRAAFYSLCFLVPLCMLVGLCAITEDRGVEGHTAPWLLLGGLLATSPLLLPILHYNQADGFYAHLFGLAPLLAGWALFGFFSSRAVRIVVLLGSVGLLRYTYGLNLGDALLTSAVLVAVEAAGVTHPGRARWGLAALAAGLGFAATFAYWKLYPLLPVTGGIITPHIHAMLRGEAVLAVLLLVLPRAARWMGLSLGDAGVRLARYAGVFGAINASVQFLCLRLGTPREYYLFKYHLHGVVLVLCAALVVLAALLAQALSRWMQRQGRPAHMGFLVPAVLVGIAVFNLNAAVAPYRESYDERTSGHAPWRTLTALSDPDGWKRIQATLSREGARFGGLIAPSWPMMNFMNAGLRREVVEEPLRFGWEQYIHGLVREGPGLCVFWYATERDFQELVSTKQENGSVLVDVTRALDARPEKQCEDYAAPWDAQRPMRLCHVCGPKT